MLFINDKIHSDYYTVNDKIYNVNFTVNPELPKADDAYVIAFDDKPVTICNENKFLKDYIDESIDDIIVSLGFTDDACMNDTNASYNILEDMANNIPFCFPQK